MGCDQGELNEQVDGLLSLFSQRLAAHAPLAAAAAKAVVNDTSLASMALTAAGRPPAAYTRHVSVSERRTYRVPLPLLDGTLHLHRQYWQQVFVLSAPKNSPQEQRLPSH